jgi:hypothetical protein
MFWRLCRILGKFPLPRPTPPCRPTGMQRRAHFSFATTIPERSSTTSQTTSSPASCERRLLLRRRSPLPSVSAPQNRRPHAAPDSSLSLSLKSLQFRSFAHLLRLRYSVSPCSHCASGPSHMGDRSLPPSLKAELRRTGRAFQAERQEIAAPAFSPVRPIAQPCRQDLAALASP